MKLWEIYHTEIPGFLAEAAQTPELRRLTDVGMNCGCEYTGFPLFAGISPYSRYDHSVGVGLIVWHFTGNPAQAMAGLLHDIATPVFAHVVDFLHGDHMCQEATEQGTAERIRSSAAISRVLQAYGLIVEAVEDYHRYPIADNDAPRLSADRLEYTLGNGVNYGIITKAQAAAYYNDLVVGENESGEAELVFRHPEIALSFAKTALACSEIYVSDPDRYAMQMLSELLKVAIEQGILSERELYTQEQAVIARLKGSALGQQWERFCGYCRILRQDRPGTDGTWRKIPAKKRCIDPYILNAGRCSALSGAFRRELQDFRERSQENWLSAQ